MNDLELTKILEVYKGINTNTLFTNHCLCALVDLKLFLFKLSFFIYGLETSMLIHF